MPTQWDTLPVFSHITGAKGPRTRREMGSLLHSNLLWLGKATAHCSHHFPSVFTSPGEREIKRQMRERKNEREREEWTPGTTMVRDLGQTIKSMDDSCVVKKKRGTSFIGKVSL